MRTKQEIIQWLAEQGITLDSIDAIERIKCELLLDIREIVNGGPV